ncbi:MAG: helix-turn-helix domain-containing protein [Hyphomonadaceae bacterium]|nr:helix-turn-helix domain-containing protein [Hyphomonadaceae bacterium]
MSETAHLPLFQIDSDVLGTQTAYMFWRQSHSALFEDNNDPPEVAQRFSIKVAMYQAGPMMLGAGTTSAQRFNRTPQTILAGGIDHYFLLSCRSGGYSGVCDGLPVSFGPGDTCLFNLSSPADVSAPDCDTLVLVLPRSLLAPLLAVPDVRGGIVLRGDTPMGRILFGSLAGIFDNCNTIPVGDAMRLARMTASLVAACYGPAEVPEDNLAERFRGVSLLAMKRYVDAHLGHPDLGVEHLTHVFGMSRASIYRIFAPLGGVAEFITRRRMRQALYDLSSADDETRQVSSVAYALGYANRTSFTRAFKAHFGISPSEARENPASAFASLSSKSQYDEPLFAEWLHEIQ